MSHDYLTRHFEILGYQVEDLREQRNGRLSQETLQAIGVGISMHVFLGNGYHISIQAGPALYCEPRKLTDSYESVEIAICNKNGLVEYDDEVFTGDNVAGWVTLKDIMGLITRCLKRKEPVIIKRPNAKWRIEDGD